MMMQISELARLADVTTRTIRHYHRIGLLPEPSRTPGGYREYGLGALSRLLQIRRLTSLGLSLSEVADALDDAGAADMREVLTELDAELAARETVIKDRRAVIARLLEHGHDPTLPAELAAAVQTLDLARPDIDALRAAAAALPEFDAESYLAGMRDDSPQRAWGERLGALAGVGADDPRVEEIARELYAMLPGLLPADAPAEPTAAMAANARFGQLMLADLGAGQRRALELLVEYGRAEPGKWER
ncbi:MerR family DNA-binding transcriptional regulator [Streptosporangium sp. NPDC004379]|uniref:MerR family DNA-binding transcriptional regulator n=1 Tax=Streptosporangium sp. NPDC004379 TaxID=3366189 RepID=UPI0036A652C9